MNSQAATEVANLAKESVAPKVVDLYPGKKLITYNGVQEKIDTPPTSRHVEASDLESFAKAALAYDCTEVWLSAEKFIAFPAVTDHNQPKVVFVPRKSAVFDLLSVSRSYRQDQLILLLRTVLRDAIAPAGLLMAVRSIKVVNSSTLTSDQQSAGNKMGREIVAEATGASQLPEDLRFTSTVFDDWTEDHSETTFDVTFACDAKQPPEFHFTPVRQQIDDAIRVALNEAEASILSIDDKFSVFRGKPLVGV